MRHKILLIKASKAAFANRWYAFLAFFTVVAIGQISPRNATKIEKIGYGDFYFVSDLNTSSRLRSSFFISSISTPNSAAI